MHMLWVAILGLLVCGWFVVDGAVLGTGVVLPLLAGDEPRRRLARTATGPFLLAGEMWLIAAAGVVIGVFPGLEQAISASYPVVTVLVAAWMLRDAALWLGRRVGSRRAWDVAWTLASVVFAFCAGMLLGVLADGVPASRTVPVRVMFGPVALSFGLLVVAVVALHGVLFTGWRVPAVAERAAVVSRRLGVAVALVAVAAATAILTDQSIDHPRGPLAALAVVAAGAVVAGTRHPSRRPRQALVWSGLTGAAVPIASGAGSADSLRTMAAATTPLTVVVVAMIVLIVAYQSWMWWVFRRPVGPRDSVLF